MLAVLSVLVIWRSLNALLRRIPNEVREPEGAELVGGELFEAFRPVNDIAARLNVASPQHILAGFHYCFYYVTELPVLHMGVKTTGRSLYVPSLVNKHLTYEEQKAILAHELAHYRSSGRSMTAEFFPLHRRIYVVTHALNLNGLIGKSNLHLIRYFYTSFEPIIRAMMARREFEADATAAGVTSRETLAKALVKIQALAKILEDLGEWIAENPNVPLSSLDLRAVGKEDFSTDQGFWEAVLNERMHHPLDNHPPLKERLHALGFALTGEHVRVITLEG
jgi:hypothetical protein